jgi:hypothetical protein
LYRFSFGHKRQTIQLPKEKRYNGQKTNNTMAKSQMLQWTKHKRYNGQKNKRLSFGHCIAYLLAIVSFVFLGHCIACPLSIVAFSFWPFYRLSFGHCSVFLLVIVSLLRWPLQWPKAKCYNGQSTSDTMAKKQTIQWPKDKRYSGQKTNVTMAK